MPRLQNNSIAKCLCATTVAAVPLLAVPNARAQVHGTICYQESEYNPYATLADNVTLSPGPDNLPLTGAFAACTQFNQNLGGVTAFDWHTYYGEIHALETRFPLWEHNFVDNTDITLAVGHANAGDSGYQLADYWTGDRAMGYQMLLGQPGSTGPGLSVLSLYTCYAITPYAVCGTNDGCPPGVPATTTTEPSPFPTYKYEYHVTNDPWTRWSKAMAGGLRMITGSWQEFSTTSSPTTIPNYGTYLKTQPVAAAWRQASFDAASNSTPAVLTTEANSSACAAKITNMSLNNTNNINTYAREYSNPGAWCWHAWY